MTELVSRCPVHGVAHSTATECWKCLTGQSKSVLPLDTHEPIGDARAQLWVRVYAAEYEVTRRDQRDQRNRELLMRDGVTTIGEYAQTQARAAADAAARDFDEHYCGGKR